MIAPARRAAITALQQVAGGHVDMGHAVARARPSLSDPRDGSLLLELVAGTLRMRAAIDYQVALRSTRPLDRLDPAVLTILRLGGFQLLYLSRVPTAAVIHDAVELTRWAGISSASGFVNAVLRKIARDRGALAWPPRPVRVRTDADLRALVTHLATVESHPAWLVERWIARHGVEAAEHWLAFNNRPPALCLATNRTRVSRQALADALRVEGVETEPTRSAPHGLLVTSGSLFSTRSFREGLCLIQDEASQLIATLVDAAPGARVLDLCGAPGGKTVAIAADVGAQGLVVACDVRPARLRVLRDTLARCRIRRAPIVHVPAGGGLPFLEGSFDTVLIDAPCSGLGTLRRDPDLRWRRSPEDLAGFAAAQVALVGCAAPLVRPGGTLVYSTCSSEPEENQEVVRVFRERHPGWTALREHQTLPFRDHLEAFFGMALRRSSVERASNDRRTPV